MSYWFARSNTVALLAALVVCLAARGGRADLLDDLELDINSWRLSEARQLVGRLTPDQLEQPRGRYLVGRLLFFEGRFPEAQAALRRAIEGARAALDWKYVRDRAAEAERALSKLTVLEGQSGKFIYHFAPGPDRLLIPYADSALARQMRALEERLGDRPDYQVQVVFAPNVETLAATSGLTVEQIERTGTVGVSKYGRLVVLSPRQLAFGYPWLDTLAHELTHLIISRITRDRAPIWLHEGVAKLLEQSWLGQPQGALTPEEAYLLDRAARESRLIPLRRFHPSVAHLSSQEDAALAYAQVLSFLGYLEDRLPEKWLPQFLARLGQGQDLDEAFIDLSKFTLERLYLWWSQAVSGKRQTPVPAVRRMQRLFKRGQAAEQVRTESLLGQDVRKHLRVGDLLRLRGHLKAAIVEFREAQRLAAYRAPAISDRLAACLLELGDAEAVVELLPPLAELYPSYSTIFIQLGQALAALDRQDEATVALERANGINPFHPAVHCKLSDLYTRLGKEKPAEMEAEHCRLLASYPQPGPTGDVFPLE